LLRRTFTYIAAGNARDLQYDSARPFTGWSDRALIADRNVRRCQN